ncbi:hypothetical protein DCC85_17995 [Paenibacillus sp. CAA11]|uniref:hypothetical protein n=1 Tax=Paenibacillus sp. CAA11 TaxID=1532905 RepID=UPI000D3C7156|nr:hypothetical protein [Paenibacillus sp. CAA11]AWB45894.1 hypothetical protein DCC85_17995 [Paenibacillus sp. CAA11]
MNAQTWIDLFKEHWYVFVIALIALFLIANLIKTVVKWVLIIAIAAFLIVYSGISLKDISNAVTTATDDTMSAMKSEAMNVMKNEAKDAKMTRNADGSFVITTPNLKVSGPANAEKVKVTFRGVSLGEWTRGEALETLIQAANQNSK